MNRKPFRTILQQGTGPVHLGGIAAWLDYDNPPVCPICKTDRYVEWHDDGWKCSNCDSIVID